MPDTATNPHERTARAAKVDALCDVLDRAKNGIGRSDTDVLRYLLELPAEGWRKLAGMAGVLPPSETTQAAVLRRFENRVRGLG